MAANLEQDVHLTVTLNVEKRNDLTLNFIPMKIGQFTVEKKKDGERVFHDYESELRILKLPSDLGKVDYDLVDGYKPLSNGGKNYLVMPDNCLNEILQWLVLKREDLDQESEDERPVSVDFVSSRGTLSRMMLMPYENFHDLLIGATLFNGTIYLHRHATEQMKKEEENVTDDINKFSYGGHRFEQYITTPAFPDLSKRAKDTKLNHEFNTVIKMNVNKFSMVFSAEMDCIKPEADPENVDLDDFVEIKSSNALKSDWEILKFHKFRSINWWAQSYLTSTPKVLCGHRDNATHRVHKLEFYDVASLPSFGIGYWNKQHCLNSLHRFLEHIKSVVTEDDHKCVYLFSWIAPALKEPDRGFITCSKTYSDKYRVVPDWFAEKIKIISE